MVGRYVCPPPSMLTSHTEVLQAELLIFFFLPLYTSLGLFFFLPLSSSLLLFFSFISLYLAFLSPLKKWSALAPGDYTKYNSGHCTLFVHMSNGLYLSTVIYCLDKNCQEYLLLLLNSKLSLQFFGHPWSLLT